MTPLDPADRHALTGIIAAKLSLAAQIHGDNFAATKGLLRQALDAELDPRAIAHALLLAVPKADRAALADELAAIPTVHGAWGYPRRLLGSGRRAA